MIKNKHIVRPIGIAEAIEKVESICASSAVYKRCGIKPQNFFIPLESGNGQTAFLNFMADMFEMHGVRRFGELDTYLEYRLDGTMAQLRNIFFEIKTPSVYEGIIAFDVTALANSLHDKQTEYFLSEVAKCAEHATLVFFASPKVKNLQALADTVCASVRDVQIVCVKPYTQSELAQMAIREIEEKGVELGCAEEAFEVLCEVIRVLEIRKACEIDSVVYTAVRNADYGSFTPTLSASKLVTVFSDFLEKAKGETK